MRIDTIDARKSMNGIGDLIKSNILWFLLVGGMLTYMFYEIAYRWEVIKSDLFSRNSWNSEGLIVIGLLLSIGLQFVIAILSKTVVEEKFSMKMLRDIIIRFPKVLISSLVIGLLASATTMLLALLSFISRVEILLLTIPVLSMAIMVFSILVIMNENISLIKAVTSSVKVVFNNFLGMVVSLYLIAILFVFIIGMFNTPSMHIMIMASVLKAIYVIFSMAFLMNGYLQVKEN